MTAPVHPPQSRPRGRGRIPLLLALATLLGAFVTAGSLGGCGVGGEGTGTFASGPVEGFGSVVVAGQRFDDSQARLRLELDPSAPQERPLAELRLGMVVQLVADAQGRTGELLLRPELHGPVNRVDAAAREFEIAGQRVRVDAVPAEPTLLQGFDALARLAAGDRVTVHGQREASGRVRASHVLREAGGSGWRVAGTASAVTAQGLTLHGLAVDLRAARTIGAAPRDGDRVAVFGAWSGGVLVAQTLAVEAAETTAPPAASAAEATVSGLLLQAGGADLWRVRGVAVNTSALAAAERAQLAAGRLVTVRGAWDGRTLRAQSLALRADGDAPLFELRARVGDFVDASRFTLRGTPVQAGSARFEGLSAANLANGVPVLLRGQVQGAAIVAAQVRADAPTDGSAFVQAGAVTEWQPTAGRLRLFGLPYDFVLSAATVFEGGSRADLADERVVQVRGTLVGNVFEVVRLVFPGAATAVELAGLAATVEFEPGGRGFLQVNEVGVVWDTATVFLGATGTSADLSEGRAVRVRAVGAGGPELRAIEIDTRGTLAGIFRLRGTVSDYRSLGDFRVEGQRVDARGAVFEPPELAQTLPGALVDVEGRMEGGVLVATRVADP